MTSETLGGRNGGGFCIKPKSWAKLGHFLRGGDAEMCILQFVNLGKEGMFPGRRPELGALNNH